MSAGVWLGIDVGKARIGVARSDPLGMLATPLETVERVTLCAPDRSAAKLFAVLAEDSPPAADVERILHLLAAAQATAIMVGLPLNLRGTHTPATWDALFFAAHLQRATSLPLRLLDERLTTVTAQAQLRASGRTTKNSRAIIDQQAAVVLLQQALSLGQGAAGLQLPGCELVAAIESFDL